VAKSPVAVKTGSRKDTSMGVAQLLGRSIRCPALDTLSVAAYPPTRSSHPGVAGRRQG
jgi:hypothetical protein